MDSQSVQAAKKGPGIVRACAGRVPWIVALAAGLVALLGLLVWLDSTPEPEAAATTPAPTADLERPDPMRLEGPDVERPERPGRPATDLRPTPDRPERGDLPAGALEGRGTLRGELQLAAGVEAPATWQLVVEPHPFLVGSERAVSRTVDLPGDEREFVLRDLPLGGYRVSARAPGLNERPASVLLVQSSPDQHVVLELARSGFVDGRVVHADGAPAEGLDVTLERVEPDGSPGERRTVRTQPDGEYVFRDVLDGTYLVRAGIPGEELVPPTELVFRAPSLRVPELELPPVGTLEVQTGSAELQAIGFVDVRGFGQPRGTLEARTDAFGHATVRFLPPGRYRLEARLEDGRSGRATVEVAGGETANAVLYLR